MISGANYVSVAFQNFLGPAVGRWHVWFENNRHVPDSSWRTGTERSAYPNPQVFALAYRVRASQRRDIRGVTGTTRRSVAFRVRFEFLRPRIRATRV